ncbi:hypothetical protein SETIT_2G417400v2 [Setaria italica]|uniref:Bifunctional inhibitor/plant lipid transfer protein/seed storage helical domain-containing protein n=1 Tax=Setaria italica TaxID=4555 RepID=K3ZXG9_SETIT|nr:uncharacterized protein LOC101763057 [Setaria italica]RCV14336.1 hypothetical protein SETIT_2G417400v2 [Setaria italica]
MAPSKMSFVIALLVALAAATPSAAFSFPPILPCIPGLPRIPLFPCVEPPPLKPVPECLTPLMNMVPACTAFLTDDADVTAPPAACCEGFREVSHMGAAICYCYVANGDIGRLLPAPMNFTRMYSLSIVCGSNFELKALAEHLPCTQDNGVPPLPLPPSPPAAGKASPPAP